MIERSHPRRGATMLHVGLAFVAYLPLLLTARDRVVGDTKQYLYLDPGRLLSRAWSMWDPNVGFGTVTHQNIGYLWPMGPFFWIFDQMGVPVWVAQRLWLGSILFAAAAGVVFLLRTLGWERSSSGIFVAALAYQCTPYTLTYAARISAILLPFAGLPWMIGLAVRALRDERRWFHAAIFALLVATVGSVNATSLIYVGLAPVLWFPYAVWISREVTIRRAVEVFARIGLLTTITQLWWIAGLRTQAKYGLPVLDFTETVDTVAQTATANEVVRGLGNWFFYGRDQLGPWIEPASRYTQHLWLITVSFAVPALSMLSMGLARFRHRVYFVALAFVGMMCAVGTHPYDDPSPLGALFKAAARASTAGLAMRSSPRAAPLVALALAVGLGAGIELVRGRVAAVKGRSVLSGLAVATIVLLVIADQAPLVAGDALGGNLQRPSQVPTYWAEAASALDGSANASSTRVLEVPGSDFASYRWGTTVDPITPGLLERPWVARELIPFGSPASANLLIALDRRLQEGVIDPEALASTASLMSAGDVVLRSDLQYERYRTPRPRPTNELFRAAFGPPRATFGPAVPNRAGPEQPLVDEVELNTPTNAIDPAPVSVFNVQGARPIVRAEPVERPVVVVGDGEGVVQAQVGIRKEAIHYAAGMREAPSDATVVLTDTNRRQAQRWGTIRENKGYTEPAGQVPLVRDTKDARLDVFADLEANAGDDDRTVAEYRGIVDVRASNYGNPVSYTPEDRPFNAIDGDVRTAWKVGAFHAVEGERWQLDIGHAVTTDHIVLVQPIGSPDNRWITRATIRLFEGKGSASSDEVAVVLDDASRTADGQDVRLDGMRTFDRLEIVIEATNLGRLGTYKGVSGVGFAEVRVASVRAEEWIRLPSAVPVGAAAYDVVVERLRANPSEPFRHDPERSMARTFTLPADQEVRLRIDGQISPLAADDRIDELLGGAPGLVVTSSDRIAGNVAARASAAIDGDPLTFWSPGYLDQRGRFIEIVGGPFTFDHLDLQVVADGRHSVPTRLRIEAVETAPITVEVPPVADQQEPNAIVKVSVALPQSITTTNARFVIDDVREHTTLDYYSGLPIAMPVGIAELGVSPPAKSALPPGDECRTDLLSIDDREIPVRFDVRLGQVVLCGSATRLLRAGQHELRTADGADVGIDINRVELESTNVVSDPPTDALPGVEVTASGRSSFDVRVTGARPGQPFWLVLGQSHNRGWTARADTGIGDLGAPALIDAMANGWLVTPPISGPTEFSVKLRWTPQRLVNGALAISIFGVVICLVVVAAGSRRRPKLRMFDDPSISLATDHTRLSTRATSLIALAALVAGAMVAEPAVGIVAAVATLAMGRLPMASRLLRVVPAALIALVGAYVAFAQRRYRYPPEFEWPNHFEKLSRASWLAVVLVMVIAVIDQRRGRISSGSTTTEATGDIAESIADAQASHERERFTNDVP